MGKNKTVGKNIEAFRKKYGFSRRQIAEYLDITISNLTQIERGSVAPTLHQAEFLANIFLVHAWDLYQRNIKRKLDKVPKIKGIRNLKSSDMKPLGRFMKIVKNYTQLKKATKHGKRKV